MSRIELSYEIYKRKQNFARMVRKLRTLQELQNFARPTTKIDAGIQLSRWKAINKTAKITRITKFCKASNENQRRNANESMEGHQRNSKNYKILQGQQRKSTQNANESMVGLQRNSENYKNYKILQGQQRKSTQKCK